MFPFAPRMTIDEHLAELRQLLEDSVGWDRAIHRPKMVVGAVVDPEAKCLFSKYGPGQVSVLTFFVYHPVNAELSRVMGAEARRVAADQGQETATVAAKIG